MKQYIMALDQGTTSSRCILFDQKGKMISMAQKEIRQIYPQPGWVEQDPREIWATQYSVMKEAQAAGDIGPEQISAIGITNQRETTIIWDRRTGEPVYNAIVWQCRRTADKIEKLRRDGMEEIVKARTGLIPDAYFCASKIAWLMEQVPGVRDAACAGELLFGTVDTWLLWKLTKGRAHITDQTNASRTMLYDIDRLCWDRELLDYFGIPMSMMPNVQPSSSIFGYTDPELMGDKIPVAGMAGDQQAALFGQCCFEKGEIKNTYGTGCFLLMNTGEERIVSQKGLLTTIAAGDGEKVRYALEGSVFVAGAAVQWLRDELAFFERAGDSEKYALSVKDSAGVYVVPAFSGMGAPYWNPLARGMITGITRGCAKEHLIRATLESVAYQVYDVMKAMEGDAGVKIRDLKADGGASANNFLMQFQSDLLQMPICRPECIETTALGAAYLAGLAVGYWKDREHIRGNWKEDRVFFPEMKEADREGLLAGWKRAVRSALFWADCEN